MNTNLHYLAYLLLFVLQTLPAQAAVEPSQVLSTNLKTLEYGPTINKLIKRELPDFTIIPLNQFSPDITKYLKRSKRHLANSIIGDFNGDNIKDLVVLGKTKSHYMITAFISHKKKYKIHIHEKWTPSEFKTTFTNNKKIVVYLSPASKKDLIFANKKHQDGFHFKSLGNFIQLYYWKSNRFKAFELGNKDVKIKERPSR